MRKMLWAVAVLLLLLSSCASLNFSNPGVGRVKHYFFQHEDIPAEFDGYRVAFLSDFHYPSLFTRKRLKQLITTVNKQHPDLLLLGGDYHEGSGYIPELFSMLSEIKATDGIRGVMGNHDYKEGYADVARAMKEHGIGLLEHKLDTIRRNDRQIIIAGVRDPFNLAGNGHSPSLDLSAEDFVILLVHTPEYVEQVPVTNTDLALAGHTHGGQVTFFGYAPILHSPLVRRFRTGLKYSSAGIPVIVTNGLGTSRKNIRMFAPSEVVIVTLKCYQCNY